MAISMLEIADLNQIKNNLLLSWKQIYQLLWLWSLPNSKFINIEYLVYNKFIQLKYPL